MPKEWQAYYDDLTALRSSLVALGERSSETIGASARFIGRTFFKFEHAELRLSIVMLHFQCRTSRKLNEIEDAIDRIFDGTFGVCQRLISQSKIV